MDWTYEKCCMYWTEMFRLHAGTGNQTLNAKCLVDAAIISVISNDGAMVRDADDIMGITSIAYKKMAIMLHAAEDMSIHHPEHIGCDVHMFKVMAALHHMDEKGEYRPQQLESYLPKELWGLINDKLCSICQLLSRSEASAKVANDLLKDISAGAADERQRKVFESFRRKILKEYNRSNLK